MNQNHQSFKADSTETALTDKQIAAFLSFAESITRDLTERYPAFFTDGNLAFPEDAKQAEIEEFFWDLGDVRDPREEQDEEPTRTEGHVSWWGDWSEETCALPVKISSATSFKTDKGPAAKSTKWPVSGSIQTWGDAYGALLCHDAQRDKGYQAILQGYTAEGGARMVPNMVAVYGVMIDVESGDPADDVRRTIRKLGWDAILVSSWSHGKDTTVLEDNELLRFLKVKDLDGLTDDDVRRYLVDRKGMRSDFAAQITVTEGEGYNRRVKHPEMDRFRVIIPLAKAYVLKEHGKTPAEANEKWGAFYRGVAKVLGVSHDRSCEDISRLMFLPEHPRGAANYFAYVIGGRSLTFEEIAPVEKPHPENKTQGRAGNTHGAKQNTTYQTKRLGAFNVRSEGVYDIVGLMQDAYGQENYTGRSAGGIAGECPLADEHTDSHLSENRSGFWCDGDGEGEAIARCSHNCHKDLKTLQFADAACQTLGIEDAGELAKYVPEIIGQPPFSMGDAADTFASFDDALAAADKLDPKDKIAVVAFIRKAARSDLPDGGKEQIKDKLTDKPISFSKRDFDKHWKTGQGEASNRQTDNEPSQDWPEGFRVIDGKLCFEEFENDRVRYRPLCAALEKRGRIYDERKQAFGCRYGFIDKNGDPADVVIRDADLMADSGTLFARLADIGLWIDGASDHKAKLVTCLSRVVMTEEITRSTTAGWGENAFALPTGHVVNREI